MTHHSVLKQGASALAVAALLGVSGTAAAIDAEFSGHVNRAIMFFDDGESSETAFVDNESSNSRVRFRGTGELAPGITAGVYGEWEFVSNNSSAVAIDDVGDGGEFSVNERHMDTFIQGDFGKLSLGQGNGAANGIAEIDLSGTMMANYSSPTDIGGSIGFVDGDLPLTIRDNGDGTFDVGDGLADTDGPDDDTVTVDQVRLSDTASNFDFESRYDRVRYDTPSFAGLSFAVATGNGSGGQDTTDLAARYSAELVNGAQFAGGLGYSTRSEGNNTNPQGEKIGAVETFGGSASLLLANGLNFTVNYTNRQDDASLDADTIWGKVGFKTGMHAVSVDVGQTSDLLAGGVFDSDSQWYGAGYTYTPTNWAELYAGIKQHSLDVSVAGVDDPDDITIGTVGTRLKF